MRQRNICKIRVAEQEAMDVVGDLTMFLRTSTHADLACLLFMGCASSSGEIIVPREEAIRIAPVLVYGRLDDVVDKTSVLEPFCRVIETLYVATSDRCNRELLRG